MINNNKAGEARDHVETRRWVAACTPADNPAADFCKVFAQKRNICRAVSSLPFAPKPRFLGPLAKISNIRSENSLMIGLVLLCALILCALIRASAGATGRSLQSVCRGSWTGRRLGRADRSPGRRPEVSPTPPRRPQTGHEVAAQRRPNSKFGDGTVGARGRGRCGRGGGAGAGGHGREGGAAWKRGRGKGARGGGERVGRERGKRFGKVAGASSAEFRTGVAMQRPPKSEIGDIRVAAHEGCSRSRRKRRSPPQSVRTKIGAWAWALH